MRRLVWWAVTRAAALCFFLMPRRSRFRFARTICNLMAPIAGSWLQRRGGRADWCTGPLDESMRLVMRVLADGGVTFDTPVVVDGDATIERRAIYVSGHFPINGFFLRHAHDQGVAPVVVKAFPEIDVCFWGTRTKFDAVAYSPAVLVKLRRRIEAGHPAVLLIDFERGTATPFASGYGNGHVATNVFDFAKRFAIPMYFFCVRCRADGVPVMVIRRIGADPNEFITNLMEQAAFVLRTPQ